MTPRELKAHKLAAKQLKSALVFKPRKRNKLPKPFKGLGGSRIQSTGMLDVSDTHVAFMYWRDGPILTDRSFYAYLFCRLANENLSPIFEFHWHPSHKGFHCKTTEDYTNRTLVRGPELALTTPENLDPKVEDHRFKLIFEFCNLCRIDLPTGDSNQHRLCQ